MSATLHAAHWVLVGLIAWVYVGYPLLLAALARAGVKLGVAARAGRGAAAGADDARGGLASVEVPVPSVAVLVAAYDEERAIERKVRTLLASAYPRDRLRVVVASDGSSDGTDAVVRAIADPRVTLLELPRGGKTRALNAAAAAAGEVDVLVMTDATTVLAPDAIAALAAAFADPSVGCVAAELVYVDGSGSEVARGTGAYWRYETAIKRLEGEVCSLIGCSGALYAVRRAAHRPIHPELDDDFTMPWEVYDQGYVTRLVRGAVSEESANSEPHADFRMRVRVALRAINALVRRRRYLDPLRYGWFSVQLMSHKALRYLVPWMWLSSFALAVVLFRTSEARALYAVVLLGHALVGSAAIVGWLSLRVGAKLPFVHVPYYFAHLNAAALWASLKYLAGDRAVTWRTDRAA